MKIVSVMDGYTGFYSMYFFMVYNFLRCKKQGFGFHLDTNRWLFKYKQGWTDYFQEVKDLPDLQGGANPTVEFFSHKDNVQAISIQFNMLEYRQAILNTLYLYNDLVKQQIEKTMRELSLVKGDYDAIFIRRGDKLCIESVFIPTEVYMDTLLQKNPNCHTVFLQTDDYNTYLDIQKYIQERGLNISAITLCSPKDLGGMVVLRRDRNGNPIYTDRHNHNYNEQHRHYFSKIAHHLQTTKSVDEMNPDEIYTHTLNMLIGVDIVLHSGHTVLDNQSNVSRFISIAHDRLNCVYDVRYPNTPFDMNRTLCPAFQ